MVLLGLWWMLITSPNPLKSTNVRCDHPLPSSVIIFSWSAISPTPPNLSIQRVWDEIFIILMTGLWLWRRGRWKLWILSLQRKPRQRSWKHVLQVRNAKKCKNGYRTALIVIAHHPFLPIIISFFHQNITKSNDQVHVKKTPLTKICWDPSSPPRQLYREHRLLALNGANKLEVVSLSPSTQPPSSFIPISSFCSWLSSIHQINEL